MTPAGRDALIVDNVDLPERIAHVILRGLPAHLDVDDLIGAGHIGLVEAARRYDPTVPGSSFREWAALRIRGAIIDHCRWQRWGTRGAWREGEVQSPLSLNWPIRIRNHGGAEHTVELGDTVPADGFEDDLVDALTPSPIPGLLNSLTRRQRAVIVAHYYGGQSMVAIGADRGVTGSAISFLHTKALRRMREAA